VTSARRREHHRGACSAAAAQAQFPGFVFTLAGQVDAHRRQARFTWGLAVMAPSR
jgi:hypothetical protein